jgi:NAD(P)-dependent dehydrogenase (short-subunit alcohol dehydrogenase family)
MPGRKDHHLPLGEQVLGVEAGRRVERPVQQRHVGAAVAQQPLLLADATQLHVDGDGVRFDGVGVEQFRQQFGGRAGLRGQDEAGAAVRRAAGAAVGGGDRVQGGLALARSSTEPASVSATERLVRISRSAPSRRSSCRIARDSGGCAIPSRSAARPKCSSSATATKYLSSRVRTVVETNVIGVIRLTNAMLPLLRRSASPRIVNLSSGVGSLTRQSDPEGETGPIAVAYAPSKTFLNAVTVQYAKELRGTGILINAACPGYTATDLNGFRGVRTPEQGAAIAIQLATLPDGGPTGGYFADAGTIPW